MKRNTILTFISVAAMSTVSHAQESAVADGYKARDREIQAEVKHLSELIYQAQRRVLDLQSRFHQAGDPEFKSITVKIINADQFMFAEREVDRKGLKQSIERIMAIYPNSSLHFEGYRDKPADLLASAVSISLSAGAINLVFETE